MEDHQLICKQLHAEGIDISQVSISDAGLSGVFKKFRLYVVHGDHGELDFTCLPSGSMTYFAVSDTEAIRLTRQGKEIEKVIAADWESVGSCSLTDFVPFVLEFYDDPIHRSHLCVADWNDLLALNNQHRELNMSQLLPLQFDLGETRLTESANGYLIRAITLCGWMHEVQNLGIENMEIDSQGKIARSERIELCERSFSRLPDIMY